MFKKVLSRKNCFIVVVFGFGDVVFVIGKKLLSQEVDDLDFVVFVIILRVELWFLFYLNLSFLYVYQVGGI